ncbi:MAG: T9SS type A sorting domain-containing protein, partial [Ignavibacteriales bacterium]|nr:T9SS type A sorting domain-containing protein [Ignavibacteriales bacterium]
FKEDFNFTAGDSLRGKNGWDIYSGGAPMLVSNFTLAFTGYAGSQIGKSLGITGGGELQTPYRVFNHLGTGSLYYSFLVMFTGSNAEGGYFTGLTGGTGGSFRGLVYAKIASGTVSFGAQATLNGTVVYDTAKYSTNKIYLVVLKYRYVDGANNDEVSLYVNENTLPLQEPSKPNVGPLLTPNDLVQIGAVTVMSGALTAGTALKGATIILDGLRVSSTWVNGVTAVKNAPGNSVPNSFALHQNYPNPFNPSTTIAYQISENGPATLKVFDLLGNDVLTLADGHHTAGNYSVRLNASHLASGCYFYTLSAGGRSMTKKLLLMK